MAASASRDEIFGLLKKLEAAASAEQFQTALHDFCKENCQAFNEGENSLECTDIHAKYTREVEALLLDSMAPEELDILTEGVDIFIHDTATVKIKGEAIRLCELEADLACLTFLLLCKDFEMFKREMLDIKGKTQMGTTVVGQPGTADDGTLNNIERYSKLLESKDGWKMLKDTPDHSYGYCAVDGGKNAWQCSIVFEATPDDVMRTMFHSVLSGTMNKYMPMCEKASCLDHVVEGNKQTARVEITLASKGLAISLMTFIMGSRIVMTQTLHEHIRGQGQHVLEMAMDGSKIQGTATILNVIQNQVLFMDRHPSDPKKCLMTVIEEWSPFVPNFVIRAIYDKSMPGMMRASIEKYKELNPSSND